MSLEELLTWAPGGSPEQALARQVDFDRLPVHVAVIMDGNGRWAAQRHLPRVEGHRAGIESVRDVVEASARLGIQVLTLYAFSVENWKRPPAEVSVLMGLLKRNLIYTSDAGDDMQCAVFGGQSIIKKIKEEICERVVSVTKCKYEKQAPQTANDNHDGSGTGL